MVRYQDIKDKAYRVLDLTTLTVEEFEQLVGEHGGKTCFPLTQRLMREHETAFKKHFSQITKAQLVTQSLEDDLQHDVSRKR
jgi:hypothetical protein